MKDMRQNAGYGKRRFWVGVALAVGTVTTAVICALGFKTVSWSLTRGSSHFVASGDAQRTVHQVTLANGAKAEVYCWHSAAAKDTEIIFERQGDRVFVRAVPKTGKNASRQQER